MVCGPSPRDSRISDGGVRVYRKGLSVRHKHPEAFGVCEKGLKCLNH